VSKGETWFFGFITIWIVLAAGEPDLLDAVIKRVGGYCTVQEVGVE